jgi:tetratricopeptide (TPR) repeat protein
MKRLIGIVLVTFMIAQTSFAQGEKSLKMASKAFGEFSADPFGNPGALDEAKTHISEAFKDQKVASSAKAWITRGDIFYNSGDAQFKGKLINPEAEISDPTVGLSALEAYTKALELASKKGDIKKAMTGLLQTEELLNNFGIDQYQAQNYTAAYDNFVAEMSASELIKSKGEASRLDAEGAMAEKKFFTGLTAYYAEDYQSSIDYLSGALDDNYSDPSTYQLIYESHKALGNTDAGLPFLEKGRAEFPDDSGLLFSEINHYLALGELSKMTDNLKEALAKEPDNQSLILTLGQVYDQLQVKSNEAGETDKANEYFDNALGYYQLALEATPENFDINYSLGALYYNKAAGYTPALNEVANDFSKAGEAKYNEIKETMAGLFSQALPYFLKADSIDGSDRNTIIALKEIFARQDNFEKSNIYKEKLENLGSGE